MHKLRSGMLSAGRERPPLVVRKVSPASLGGSLAAMAVKRAESRVTNKQESERLMQATVRWCDGDRMGASFVRKIDMRFFSISATANSGIRKIDRVKPDYLSDERDPGSPHANRDRLTPADLAQAR